VSEHVLALSTVPTRADAERIAQALVEHGLAACVSVVPQVLSVYRWQGEVERTEEHLLLIKTRHDRFEELRAALVAVHPYDVPELIAFDVAAAHAPYLAWLDASLVPPVTPCRDERLG
jgi:periplasmic divalent cation tolerance protein